MEGGVQAGVEEEGLVVPLVSQLEESSVGVDCVPEVGPQGQVLGAQEGFPLDRGHARRSVEVEQSVAEFGADHAGEESGDGDGDPAEGEDGEGEPAGGLRGEGRTMKAARPKMAAPETASCS